MKKSTLLKLMLILLPIAAVCLATTPDSVRAFSPETGETLLYSYFDLMDVGTLQMMTPMAAVLCLVSGILAAVYLGLKKAGCLKWAGITALLAAIFATLPVILRGAYIIIPNVLLPLLMLGEAFLARHMHKHAEDAQKDAPRLDLHR